MIYLASGWWRPGHLADLLQLEGYLKERRYAFFSPRLEGECKPDADKATRSQIFQENLAAIRRCNLIFARIDDYDPGTIWEMGFGHCLKKDTVAWSLVEGRGLNLMLAEGCNGFVNGWKNIKQFFSNAPNYDWRSISEWRAKIQ